MEPNNEIEDDALGRWLSGEMSPEELKEFEASEAFETYNNIKNYTEGMEMPAYDMEKEFALLNETLKSNSSGKDFLTSTIFFLISLESSTVDAPLLA